MTKIPRGQTPERRAYMKAYMAVHGERIKAERAEYFAAYRKANKHKDRAYRQANAARLKARAVAYYKANRERILAQVKARAAANPEAISDYHAKHYERNADRIKANVRVYQRDNPDKKRHLQNRRRARKFANGGSHTLAERKAKFALFCNRCAYCGSAKNLSVDHKIPLKRGGTDNITNIVPCCRSCNSRKNARTADEYIRAMKRMRLKAG